MITHPSRTTFTLLLLIFSSVLAHSQTVDQDFLQAVQDRDFAKVESLLSKGANVNAQEPINGHFALQYAINWPDARLVKLLLDKGANVNLADKIGYTALTDAARGRGTEYVRIVSLLLDHGADVRASNDASVFSAATGGETEILRMLLAKGAPLNAKEKNRDSDTVLMVASGSDSLRSIELLLNAGADIRGTNERGQTALMKAVAVDQRYGPETRLPMIDLLIKKGSNINARDNDGRSALHYSVVQYMSEAGGIVSHKQIVQLLLDQGADVQAKDLQGNTALLLTAGVSRGPLDIVRLLLARGIDANAQNTKGLSSLMTASDRGRMDVVQLLLENGARVDLADSDSATALDYAVAAGYQETAKLLFAKGARSRKGYTDEASVLKATTNFALHRAVMSGNLNDVKMQLAAGADVNVRSDNGWTPLLLAAQYDYSGATVITYLLEKGADPNLPDSSGETPLMIVATRNNLAATTALLAYKASVYPRNQQKKTVLHLAAGALNATIVKALLAVRPEVGASSAGVDIREVEIDVRDEQGRTPLLLAADNEGRVPDEVMELLLTKGADINARDNDGNTALMLTAKSGSIAGVDFLIQHNANVNVKNQSGKTAIQFARALRENKKIFNASLVEERIVASLLKAGAKE